MASFFTTSTKEEMVKDSQGGSFINESGIYDVVLKAVIVTTNESKARSLDFLVDYDGTESMLYGLKLDMNNGNPHYQQAIFNKLLIIAGIQSIDAPSTEGRLLYDFEKKQQVLKDISVITELDDLAVKVRVKLRYHKYNDKIYEKREIQGFYRADDGATASEVLNGTEAGVQLEKDLKYANKIRYDDGLTEEDIIAWKASKGKGGTTATTATQADKAVENPFEGNA